MVLNYLKTKKRSVAVISDKFCQYPEECKIIRMLFNEGIYSILDVETIHTEENKDFLKVRLSKFLDKLGMESDAKMNIIDILMSVFVFPKQIKMAFDISNECEIGKMYFIAVENSPEKELKLYQITSSIKSGTGLFQKQGISTYIEALNATTDAYRYICDKCSIKNIKEEMRSKDYVLNYSCVNGKNMTSHMEVGTLLALCSGALNKVPLSGLVVFGSFDFKDNHISVDNLIESFRICNQHKARFLLMPVAMAVEISNVPPELLGVVSIIFYSSLDDMIIKALNISNN